MLQRNSRLLNCISAAIDGVLVFGSYLFSVWLYLSVLNPGDTMTHPRTLFTWVSAAMFSMFIVLLLALFRMYNFTRINTLLRRLGSVWLATLMGILCGMAILFLYRQTDFSREVIAVFTFASAGVLSLKYVTMWLILRSLRKKGYDQKDVLVVGCGKLAELYTGTIAASPALGFRILEQVDPAVKDAEAHRKAVEHLEEQLNGSEVDEVVIALEPEEISCLTDIIRICEKCGTKVSVIPFYNNIIPHSATIESIGEARLINLRANPLDNVGFSFLKRTFDIFSSAFLLILLSPLFLIIAIGIKLSSPGPVFYRQTRVGRGKKRFQMLKFRSMRMNETGDTAWTTSNDSRKTFFGSLIRKCSMDELPQLWNVLKGEMSLIGPRPEIPYYVEQFKDSVPLYMVKHQVRPGMTGWAQVNGWRGDTSIVKRIEFDVWYIENWSLRLDMKILLMTAFGGWLNSEKYHRDQGGNP